MATRKDIMNAALKALLKGIDASPWLRVPATFISELAGLPEDKRKDLDAVTSSDEQFEEILTQLHLATTNAALAAVGTEQIKVLVSRMAERSADERDALTGLTQKHYEETLKQKNNPIPEPAEQAIQGNPVASTGYDVFLSHNSSDKPTVIQLAEELKSRGIRVWLDAWSLIPGRPWIKALEEIIQTTKSAAVLVGPDGIGPWQSPEMYGCLYEFVNRNLPVIPVLLPGSPQKPDLPLFLKQFTWVDFRQGITPEYVDRLVCGIKEVPPGEPTPADKAKIKSEQSFLHNLPYLSLGDLFKGRIEILGQMKSDLDTNKKTAIIQTIHGLGGIGKTRLAVEFAWWAVVERKYQTVFFVNAESPEMLEASLASFAVPDRLHLTEPGADQKTTKSAVLDWLSQHSGWLMILDNADTDQAAQAVETLLPTIATGHIIITSRYTHWGAGIGMRSLGLLKPDDARAFLFERTAGRRIESPDDETAANRLAKELGYLPLVLEQAAAYIAHENITFGDYMEEWNHSKQTVLAWCNQREMKYPLSAAVTYQRTFEKLSPAARAVLQLAAFLAPEPLPTGMFEKGKEWILQAARIPTKETPLTAEIPDNGHVVINALGDLSAYSMIDKQAKTFTVHRIVQEVIRNSISIDHRREWIEKALNLVNDYAPGGSDDVRTWPIWDILAAHAETIAQLADQYGMTAPTSRLMSCLDCYFFAKGLYPRAEIFSQRALAIDEASFGKDHPKIAIRLNNLAALYQATNRLNKAELLCSRALAIDEASFGKDHPNVAIRLNNLAQLCQDTNRLNEAEPLMTRALAINEASFGKDHPKIAICLNNLAVLYQATNRLNEAEPLMTRALAIDEASFGKDHPDVAIDLNNLAQLYKATNRLNEAELLCTRALAIDEASFGKDHPNVAIDLNNLAALYQATNRLKEAEPLMTRVVEIVEKTYGNNHPNVATALNNLAQLYQATNRLKEAEPLMTRALAIDEASFGKDHPTVAIRLNNLAQLYKATNRLNEAEPLYKRALAIDEASFGKDHPDVAIDLNNLASLYLATNRLNETEPLMKRALAIDEVSFGKDHPNVAIDLNNLAQLYRATNRLNEAEPLMTRALTIFETNLGPKHPRTQTVRKNLEILLHQKHS
jgi:tetratricopeptide (TPR) repeat protein